jgi:rhodanese-related sulfurtransferase
MERPGGTARITLTAVHEFHIAASVPRNPIIGTLPKDKNVILYCGSGGRAVLGGKLLKDMGYELRPDGFSDVVVDVAV